MRQAFRAKTESGSWGPIRLILFSVTVMLLAAVIFAAYDLTFQPRYLSRDTNMDQVISAVEITKDTKVSQCFRYDKAICGISVLMKNTDSLSAGQISIQVRDLSTDQVLCDKTLEAKDITDGGFCYLRFGSIVTSEKGYEVLVTSEDAKPGSSVSLWMSQTVNDQVDGAVINGKTAASSLAFTTYEEDASYHPLGLFINRLVLAVLFFTFLIFHFFTDIPRLYDWIFRKRFWVAAGIVILFVINKYNFSSITMFNNLYQHNYGSEYVSTIFGQARDIRSDEWLAVTPARLSARYADYARINDILRAAPNDSLPLTGLYYGFAALSRPTLWGYYLLGSAYGLSFSNITFILGTFLVSFEMFLILTKEKRLYSLLGGVLITCSSCFLWWSNANWILAAQGAFVCLYYFLQSDKIWKRVLLILGMAVLGSNFIAELYPAWQVPVGYLFLVLIIWMLIVNRRKVKAFRAWDWAILALGLCFMAAICVSCFIASKEYIEAIMNTTYPGRRISAGGYALDKLFGNLKAWSIPFDGMNDISSASGFLNFYPLPSIIAIFLLIRKKGKDGLLFALLGVSLLLTLYCSFGLPDFLARITLLSYSTPDRASDVIAFIEVYLLILSLCRLDDQKRPRLVISVLMLMTLGAASAFLSSDQMTVMPGLALAAAALLCAAVLISDGGEKFRKGAAVCLIAVSVVTSLFVLPLSKGIDAIYSKPVSHEIQLLNEGGGKRWMTLDSCMSGNFLVALGAPSLTSVNFTPNSELWSVLDPDGTYKSIYDRYAFYRICLCQEETHFVLRAKDCFDLYLSYKDIYKLDADYIFCTCKLSDNPYVHFEQIYYEAGTYIYEPVFAQHTTE